MDMEDEAMPYLKLLNENSGNYLLQNSYELQDCLSVEPMFTEIETESWPSECFPVLINDGNMKCTSDQMITEKVHSTAEGKHSNIIFSQTVDSGSINMYQKDIDTTASDITENIILSQDSLLRVNSRMLNDSKETQQGKQKRTLLMFPNGNTYQISYSNKSFNPVDLYVEENLSDIEDSNPVSPNQLEDQETTSTLQYSRDPENDDLSDWNEFYSIVTVMKCKVCSFLCESSVEMIDHLKRLHGDLLQLKQLAEKKEDTDGVQKVKMKSLLDSNSTAENKATVFLCSICNNIFSTKELLMKHVKIHNQDAKSLGVTNDSVNDETTDAQNDEPKNSMRDLATSLLRKQQKAMNKMKCSVEGCTLKFSCDESKLSHEECHVPYRKHFQCPECKEKISIWKMCVKHLWTCHKIDIDLYTCPICNTYKSYSRVAVMNHMDIHNSEKPFVCTVCSKGFKQPNQLRNHKLIHKRDEEVPPWSLRCLICERFFANDKSLKKHVQIVHEKIKPFICNICGYKTSRKSTLELHIRQHTGDKPHHCHYCTYRTADHNSLRKHVMKHTGSMKYSCPYCKYQAIQSSAYKKHLVKKHPEAKEIFKCGHCTFTSLRYDPYLTHVKCHEYEEANCKKKST